MEARDKIFMPLSVVLPVICDFAQIPTCYCIQQVLQPAPLALANAYVKRKTRTRMLESSSVAGYSDMLWRLLMGLMYLQVLQHGLHGRIGVQTVGGRLIGSSNCDDHLHQLHRQWDILPAHRLQGIARERGAIR